MIVALDARKLRDGGIGTYIRGLLDHDAGLDSSDVLVALVDPADRERVATRGVVRVATVRAGKYGLREHVAVPAAARAAHAGLLHEPHYTLPLGWRGPSVVTIHDLIHLRFPQFFPPGAALYARLMAGSAARRARIVLTDSEAVRRDVVERLGIDAGKVRVVPLGVSPVFQPMSAEIVAAFRHEHGLPRDYVLYVGAHRPHKNLALLADAWATLAAAERPPLVLATEPWPPDHPLARRIAARGVGASIRIVSGIRGDLALACLYGGAALYVQPSLDEGFGLPPLEAMACGTPVLASDAGSLPEVLGGVARLLPPRDPAAWASAIQQMLADTSDRAARVAAARAHAARYTWSATAAMTRAAYADAVR